MKFGADFRRYQRNFYQSQATAGLFLFSGQFAQNLQTGAARNVMADLLLGLPVYRQEDGLPDEDRTLGRTWRIHSG